MSREIVDQAALLEQVEGDEELLRGLVELFVEGLPAQVDAIHDAIARGDGPAVERAAHSLKGALSNLHAPAAAETAYRLELMGREADLEDAAAVFGALEEALECTHS